jgi:nucleoid DNA-binding protein
MNPKSHKELKKGIAEEVGVHPQVVEDLISFYYGKVRKTLSQLEFPRVYIQGLGTFQLRKAKIEKAIKKNKSMLGNVAKRTYNGFAKSEDIQKDINEMENALKQMEEDILNKKEFKNK